MANPNLARVQADRLSDTFELYDLRVEVVCPPNDRILCGAKNGDYFILEGEMLKLPSGQGISIYSLSAKLTDFLSIPSLINIADRCRVAAPCCKTEDDAPKRLDDD